jgi:hypothetical protein
LRDSYGDGDREFSDETKTAKLKLAALQVVES